MISIIPYSNYGIREWIQRYMNTFFEFWFYAIARAPLKNTLWRLRWLNPILRGQTECLWWCLNIITWCNFLDVPVQEWDHPDHYKPGHLTPIHLNQTFKGLRHQSFQFFHKQDVGTSVPAETTKGPSSPLNLQKCQSILGHWLSILWFIVFFLAWEMHWRKLVLHEEYNYRWFCIRHISSG